MRARYLFKLRFNKKAIQHWAGEYPTDYDKDVEALAPQSRERGYLLKSEFETICRWKTPRSQKRVASNPVDYIEAVTQTALSTPNERLQIEVLLLLSGVRWPTASVILHFCHRDPYPILDYRALWSLGVEAKDVTYNFDFWWAYTSFSRKLAQEAGVSMRELDRALWQFSKTSQ